MSKWSEHVQRFAKKHKMSYNEAKSNPKCQEQFKKKRKKKVKSPRGYDDEETIEKYFNESGYSNNNDFKEFYLEFVDSNAYRFMFFPKDKIKAIYDDYRAVEYYDDDKKDMLFDLLEDGYPDCDYAMDLDFDGVPEEDPIYTTPSKIIRNGRAFADYYIELKKLYGNDENIASLFSKACGLHKLDKHNENDTLTKYIDFRNEDYDHGQSLHYIEEGMSVEDAIEDQNAMAVYMEPRPRRRG